MEVRNKNVVQITWDAVADSATIFESLLSSPMLNGMFISPTTSFSIRDLLEKIAKVPWINSNIVPATPLHSL